MDANTLAGILSSVLVAWGQFGPKIVPWIQDGLEISKAKVNFYASTLIGVSASGVTILEGLPPTTSIGAIFLALPAWLMAHIKYEVFEKGKEPKTRAPWILKRKSATGVETDMFGLSPNDSTVTNVDGFPRMEDDKFNALLDEADAADQKAKSVAEMARADGEHVFGSSIAAALIEGAPKIS